MNANIEHKASTAAVVERNIGLTSGAYREQGSTVKMTMVTAWQGPLVQFGCNFVCLLNFCLFSEHLLDPV
jgi:hypothetical protein